MFDRIRRLFRRRPTLILYYYDDVAFLIPEFQKRVRKGAALLDEKLPVWYESIDLASFEMQVSTACVLGQTWMKHNGFFDGFTAGTQDLFGEVGGDTRAGRGEYTKQVTHGFMLEEESREVGDKYVGHHAWELLAGLWALEVRNRRDPHQKVFAMMVPTDNRHLAESFRDW